MWLIILHPLDIDFNKIFLKSPGKQTLTSLFTCIDIVF